MSCLIILRNAPRYPSYAWFYGPEKDRSGRNAFGAPALCDSHRLGRPSTASGPGLPYSDYLIPK
jgi:hypothetical protein